MTEAPQPQHYVFYADQTVRVYSVDFVRSRVIPKSWIVLPEWRIWTVTVPDECCQCFGLLADRTNGRAIGTVLRLSVCL